RGARRRARDGVVLVPGPGRLGSRAPRGSALGCAEPRCALRSARGGQADVRHPVRADGGGGAAGGAGAGVGAAGDSVGHERGGAGGHEPAWSAYLGLVGSGLGPRAGQRWGVLNLDAHFDLREEARPTSGTPFAQMAAAEQQVGRELHYAVLGIAEPSNTGALFDRDRELGVRWWTDEQCLEAGAAGVARFVEEFAAELAVHYLTNDLDVLPAAVAPGVSAPAAYGVPLPLVAAAVRAAARSGTLTLL